MWILWSYLVILSSLHSAVYLSMHTKFLDYYKIFKNRKSNALKKKKEDDILMYYQQLCLADIIRNVIIINKMWKILHILFRIHSVLLNQIKPLSKVSGRIYLFCIYFQWESLLLLKVILNLQSADRLSRGDEFGFTVWLNLNPLSRLEVFENFQQDSLPPPSWSSEQSSFILRCNV